MSSAPEPAVWRPPLGKRIGRAVTGALQRARAGHDTPWRRFVGLLEMLFVDHAIFRVVYANRHALGPALFRAAQPTPGQLARYARSGIRTIVNLRGARVCASYDFEREACGRLGLTLIDQPIASREAPPRDRVLALIDLFERIEYPALIHCKSGADRAGLASAIYELVRNGGDPARAQAQLHWRFGHFRFAKTGILDRFIDAYAAAHAATGIGFRDWVATTYDPAALAAGQKVGRLSNFLVERVLGRE